jgi:hypothetical protein
MKRSLIITLLSTLLATPAPAKGVKGHHKASHKPRHHKTIVVKPIKTMST